MKHLKTILLSGLLITSSHAIEYGSKSIQGSALAPEALMHVQAREACGRYGQRADMHFSGSDQILYGFGRCMGKGGQQGDVMARFDGVRMDINYRILTGDD